MFRTLSYDVTFSTGRRLCENIDFSKGMTVLQGANESGKSFALEMMRYGLFGTKALRGTAEDYEKLTMSVSFDIRGETYRLDRTPSKATLYRGEAPIATGTSPVNEKIVSLMGFGLDVFDVACVANQHDLLRLTNMRPTERKRLVDSVIGIGALEAVGKWAKDEALTREREAKGARSALNQPTMPAEPEGYRPSAEIKVELDKAREASNRVNELRGWLSQTREAPKKPVEKINLPSSGLKGLAAQQKETRLKVEELKTRLRVLPETRPELTTDQIEALRKQIDDHAAWRSAQRVLHKYEGMPPITLKETEAHLHQWKLFDTYESGLAQAKRIQAKIEQAEKGMLECPSCHHKWHTDADHIADLRVELAACAVHEVAKPDIERQLLEDFRRYWSGFDEAEFTEAKNVPEVADPGISQDQLTAVERTIQLFEERAGVEAELKRAEAAMPDKDFEAMLAERLQYESAVERYHEELLAFNEWEAERQKRRLELATLEPVAAKEAQLSDQHSTARIYEAALVRYQDDLKRYNSQVDAINEMELEATEYRKGQEVITRVRQRVKQYLLPSLNAAASRLLSRMTGGSRNVIHVDDDFEILVDGQKANTLSGSGLVCANLALRIALGQVLVNNVFSVFLGDELDGSMDAVRSKETALTLGNLAKQVSQVIVVSHKSLPADHEIVLGELNGHDPYSIDLHEARG